LTRFGNTSESPRFRARAPEGKREQASGLRGARRGLMTFWPAAAANALAALTQPIHNEAWALAWPN